MQDDLTPVHAAHFRIGCFAIIERGGRYLLAQRRDIGWWYLPGGGLERGETVLQALEREVREEVGLAIEVVRLVGVYSKTRKPEVVLTFLCRPSPTSGPLEPGEEIAAAGWFLPGDWPEPLLPKHRRRLDDALAGADQVIFGVEATSSAEDQGLARPH